MSEDSLIAHRFLYSFKYVFKMSKLSGCYPVSSSYEVSVRTWLVIVIVFSSVRRGTYCNIFSNSITLWRQKNSGQLKPLFLMLITECPVLYCMAIPFDKLKFRSWWIRNKVQETLRIACLIL